MNAPAGYRTFRMGRGVVKHAAQDTDTLTLCKKRISAPAMTVDNWVTCTACVRAAKKIEETKGENVAAKQDAESLRNDVNTDEGRAAIEQITANIERAGSLRDAESLKELGTETETLISSLSGKGSIAMKKSMRETWAKTEDESLKAAAEPEPSAEVAVKSYTDYEGVPELIAEGAERVAEGARLHIAAKDTARAIARIGLDMWRRMEDKDGNPDIDGKSVQAKEASIALKQAAGQALGRAHSEEDGFDVEEALRSLWRSVQYHRTDVRAQYLRALDDQTEEAEAERKRFATILANKPEDVPVSKWVADHYGLPLVGEREKRVLRFQRQKALAEGQTAPEAPIDDEPSESPDERVATTVRALKKDVTKLNPADFEQASDEAKKKAREELMPLLEAVKAAIAATI